MSDEQQQDPIDILEHLHQLWCKANPIKLDDDGAQTLADSISRNAVARFITASRIELRDNQPVGIDYVGDGLGVRFQDASVIQFVSKEDAEDTVDPNSHSVAVTPEQKKKFESPSMESSPSFPVTKGDLGKA